ncbi:MAG: hypothetical protein IM530_08140 [Microcystis sp. M53BS1]|uniref:hypothetical protein n=1 Tax=Microcystis sp. M53BS1 TaxID=2771197 RepID=UPI00258C84CF|nr:hypothetical protein [Microcystis sp. M53BS1]MCA2548845.1 hypothetical protein [Microcystis sp. M53BS1]
MMQAAWAGAGRSAAAVDAITAPVAVANNVVLNIFNDIDLSFVIDLTFLPYQFRKKLSISGLPR